MENNASTPPPFYRPYLRFGLFFSVFVVIGLGVLASVVTVAGAVIASGSVQVRGKAKSIQHPDGGVVVEILVEDGDLVEEGDTLLRLDAEPLIAKIKVTNTRLVEAYTTLKRLDAEKDELEELPSMPRFNDDDLDELLNSQELAQRNLFYARQSSLRGQEKNLRERIEQYKSQISGLEGLQIARKRQLELLQMELDDLKALRSKSFVSATRTMAQEREVVGIEGDIARGIASIAEARNSISQVEIEILQFKRENKEKVLTALGEMTQRFAELQQQRTVELAQLSRVELKAPVSGFVHGLSAHTVSGVIAPGAVVMQVVPREEDYVLEGRVDPLKIDRVVVGQDVRVRFSAFNSRTTPALNGHVQLVSPDRLVDTATNLSYYMVWVELEQGEAAKLEGKRLVPGMPVEIFIQTPERTILSYLLKPLLDALSYSLREN